MLIYSCRASSNIDSRDATAGSFTQQFGIKTCRMEWSGKTRETQNRDKAFGIAQGRCWALNASCANHLATLYTGPALKQIHSEMLAARSNRCSANLTTCGQEKDLQAADCVSTRRLSARRFLRRAAFCPCPPKNTRGGSSTSLPRNLQLEKCLQCGQWPQKPELQASFFALIREETVQDRKHRDEDNREIE